jgi:tellurite resistance protein TehA-like permease
MIWAVFLVVWVVLCLLIVMFVRGGTRKPSPKPPTKLQAVPPLPLGAWVEDRDE